MATGILGTADLTAGADTTVYTVPADTFAVTSVSFCNRGNSAITVRLAVCVADTATADAYVAAVVESDDANYQKNGNIRITAGDIFIYVE